MNEAARDDVAAVGWAWTTGSPTGQFLRERVARGEEPMTIAELDAAGYLATIRAEWIAAGRPAAQRCLHREVVTFVDGTEVVAVSFLGGEPYKRDVDPHFGLYLDPRWNPPWPHGHVTWPDFGVVDGRELAGYLQDLLVRVRRGARVEIGCLGGHGRTGTALGCMAILTGTPRHQAVDWVRANYCSRAIETPEQQAFVEAFGR